MPRRTNGPYLYLDPRRKTWAIRDGKGFVRTGCAKSDNEGAQKQLAEYIAGKYRPAPSASPLIADVLLVYAKEHLPSTRAKDRAAHNISNLEGFWGRKMVSDVNASNCRLFAASRPRSAARRDLEVLRAAINYWHKNYGPIDRIPTVLLPDKEEARDRWLTQDEARRLRKAAMKHPHLYRFVILGLKTGSRSGVLVNLQWDWIDLDRGIMHRRGPREAENSTKRTPPVRLGRSMVRLLRLWKRKDHGIAHVVHYDGKPVQKLRKSWERACVTAGIVGASPHTLRHTRATWLMQAGIDIWEAAGNLGMSVGVLQRVYGKHSPDFQSRAAEI